MLAINENLKINELKIRLWAVDGVRNNYETVDLSGNDLPTLQVIFPIWFERVKNLSLNSCHLKTLKKKSIDNLTALETLQLNDNELYSFPVAFFRNCCDRLKVLLLEKNRFRSYKQLTFEPMRHLVELNFGFNSIRKLEKVKSDSLEILKLNSNRIEEMKNLYLPQLKYFDVSDNLLVELNAFVLIHSPLLIEARFSKNSIDKIAHKFFEKHNNLKFVYFDQNNLTGFEAIVFHPDSKLEKLNLAQNRLTVLQLNRFKHLKMLNLNGNFQLKKVYGWSAMMSLEKLNFNGLVFDRFQLPDIKFTRALKKLDLRETNIDQFPEYYFEPLEQLEKLYLDQSQARNLTILTDRLFFTKETHQLNKLSLKDCNVQAIENQCFRCFVALTSLDLSKNLIVELNRNIFRPLVSLKWLYLQNNCLYRLDENVFWDLAELQFINLTMNFINELSLFMFIANRKLIEQRLDPGIHFTDNF